MNGVHDMGGMDGFGPVVREDNEPVFHAAWEPRVFALANLSFVRAGVNVDEFRHAIERIPPARYLASSYYERWLAAVETLLVERGVVTREELLARYPLTGKLDWIARAVATTGPAARDQPTASGRAGARLPRARFKAGDIVRARNLNPSGHTRLPRYVRGKTGAIARDWGVFDFPDTNAHHAGRKPQHCYSVSFTARELWGKSGRERLLIDLWEDYLEPAGPKRPSRTRKSTLRSTRRIARKRK